MKIDSRKIRNLMASQGYTYTSLAKEAGMSRQALHAILNKDWAEVRGATARGLVRALKLPDESVLREDPLIGYKAFVADEYARLDFRGLGLPAAEPQSFDELFIPLRARLAPMSNHSEGCATDTSARGGGEAERGLPAQADSREPTVAECLVRHRRLLLRGEPGSGKTTALQHIARSYARTTQTEDGYPSRPLTPLFVRLAEYAKARK